MRVPVVVVLFCLLVLGVQILATISPSPHNWGVHHYAFLARGWLVAGVLGAALLLSLFVLRIPSVPKGRVPSALVGLGAAGVGAAVFWIARAQSAYLGDGIFWIESLRQGRLVWIHEPAAVYSALGLSRVLGSPPPERVYALLSVFAGAVFVLCTAVIARRTARERRGQVLVFGLLVLAGLTRLFYGYAESFPLLAAATMAYLLVALRYLQGRGSVWLVGLFSVVPWFVHMSGVFLFPSFLYVLWAGRSERSREPRHLAVLLIPAAALGGTILLLSTVPLSLGEVLGSYGRSLAAWGEGSTPWVPYALPSSAHLSDLLQEQLLVGPFGALFLLVLLVALLLGRVGREARFLLWAGVPWWLFSLFATRPAGAARDWDQFAVASIPLVLVSGIVLARRLGHLERARWAGALAGLVLATSFFHTLPWVGLGMDQNRSLGHFIALFGQGSRASGGARSLAFDAIGTSYLERGEANNARRAYEAAALLDTTNTNAYGHLASMLIGMGRTREGALILERAIRLDPKAEYLHYELGNAYRVLGAADSAAVSYYRAIELNPDFRQAYINLAVIERGRGRLGQAEGLLRKAQQQFPHDPLIFFNLGRVAQARGDTLQAIGLYRDALREDPDDVTTAYNLGLLLMAQSRFREATGYFQMVVNRNPQDAEAWINLGVTRDLLGESEPAQKAFSQAMAADPSRHEPYFNLFRARMAMEDTSGAVAILTSYANRDSTTRFGEIARALLLQLTAGSP